jgi:hypothetical protein
MKRLTAQLKKALAALAYADAGEMLPGRDKNRVLGISAKPRPAAPAPAPVPPRPRVEAAPQPSLNGQVGLYLGATLDPAVVHYAADTCREINAALTVVTFQSEDRARELLEPHLAELGREGVVWRIARLRGEPRTSLSRFLRHEPRMLFLVCSESGFLGHAVRSGVGRRMDFGLPIVMVTAEENAPTMERPRIVARS